MAIFVFTISLIGHGIRLTVRGRAHCKCVDNSMTFYFMEV